MQYFSITELIHSERRYSFQKEIISSVSFSFLMSIDSDKRLYTTAWVFFLFKYKIKSLIKSKFSLLPQKILGAVNYTMMSFWSLFRFCITIEQ